MKKFLKGVCVCLIILFSLTGCSTNSSSNINDKLNAELEYIEDLIFKIANQYAKEEYIENEKINWDYIKGDLQTINDTWNTLILDLTEVNVANEEILAFSNELNDLLISFSKKDEKILIDKLNNMYAKVIIFKQSYSNNKNEIEKNKIKGEVLAVFSIVNRGDFESAKTSAQKLVENYKQLMNNREYAQENGYNLNKIYIILEEYRNSIHSQNYDLIRMKYITAVENL